MSQPYTDWEFVESQKYDSYQYIILKVVSIEYTGLKAWVYATGGTTWLQGIDLDNLRSACMTHGRQLG